tara:strand:- start:8216 stop:8653 length:438 start_codon:yes stop_codon:yes gene_type:complete
MNFKNLTNIGRKRAKKSNCHYPMSALVLRNGKIVASGVNKKGFRGTSIHAEIDALRQLRYNKKRAKGSTMFISRHTKAGLYANAKPCANCLEVMKMVGVKQVAWTTKNQTVEIANLEDIKTDYLPTHSKNKVIYTGLETFSVEGV